MSDTVNVRHILSGRLTNLPQASPSVVRVFISSTFTDMICERNALLEHVYPKIQLFCNQHGLQFQVVDMRWGVTEEAQDDHMTSDLCIKEIHKCQRLSAGPCIVVLLGQKYGYRPFPAQIPEEEFNIICQALENSGKETALLNLWYQCDTNKIPPVRQLLPISSQYPDYNHKDSAEKRKQARDSWWKTFEQIQSLLRHGVTSAVQSSQLTEEASRRYFISVTADEIHEGLLKSKNPESQICIWRQITDLKDNIVHSRAPRFTDILPDNGMIDAEAQGLLSQLIKKDVITKLQEHNVLSYNIEWDKEDGISTTKHQKYLMDLCKAFEHVMKNKILGVIQKQTGVPKSGIVLEVLQHLRLCKSRCEGFHGRKDVLKKVMDFVNGDSSSHLVIFGESGCGKTSVMAKAASMIHSEGGKENCHVILRFLGTSPQSSSLEGMLVSVCQQIAQLLQKKDLDTPDSYQAMVAQFKALIEEASEITPMVIFLDSLDQLSDIQKVSNLMWLPRKLPPRVKIIVSTLCSGEYHIIKDHLHSVVPTSNFEEVLPLNQATCYDILKDWLDHAGCTLTNKQFSIVKSAFGACSLPLYTKLVFDEVSRWHSYTEVSPDQLQHSVPGVINTLFERLEVQYGKTFVTHSLSYITCSRNGLSEVELEDILSLDDDVLNAIFSFWLPPVRRVPPVLWTRIREHLDSYLTEREASGVTVISWYHRQFREVASKRYLQNSSFKEKIHEGLADYFSGKWADGRKKPFTYPEKIAVRMKIENRDSEADRRVSRQPLFWTRIQDGKTVTLYNKRKLMELPYHQLNSKQYSNLKDMFTSFEWISAKLKACSHQDYLEDLVMAKDYMADLSAIQLVEGTIRRAASALKVMPGALAAELIGRLHGISSLFDDVGKLLSGCKEEGRKTCTLLPSSQCFEGPSPALMHSLEGFTKRVTDLEFSHDSRHLVTVTEEGDVAFWDLKSGDIENVIETANLATSRYTDVHLDNKSKVIVETYQHTADLASYDLLSGQCEYRISSPQGEFKHNLIVTENLVCRKGDLYRRIDGCKLQRLPYLADVANYVTAGVTDDENHILVSCGNNIDMYNLNDHNKLASLTGQSSPSSLAITRSSIAVVGYTVSCDVRFFDVNPNSSNFAEQTGKFSFQSSYPNVQFLKGDRYCQEVSTLALSQDQEHVIVNVKKKHLFSVGVKDQKGVMMEWRNLGSVESFFTDCAAYTMNDDKVVGLVGPILCLWDAASGDLLCNIQFSQTTGDRYTLVTAPTANMAATSAKLSQAIQVWDLNQLLKEKTRKPIHCFKNPIDMCAVSKNNGAIFVKTYTRLDSNLGYHQINYFGIDCWFLQDQNCKTFLDFGEYGQLRDMICTNDGTHLGIVVQCQGDQMVYVLDIPQGDLQSHLILDNMKVTQLKFSQDNSYFLIAKAESDQGTKRKVKSKVTLHEIHGKELLCINALSPVFVGCRVACITDQSKLVLFDLKDKTFKQTEFALKGKFNKLIEIPGSNDKLLILGSESNDPKVIMYDLEEHHEIFSVSCHKNSRICDISDGGSMAVDDHLVVYDLKRGIAKKTLSQPGKCIKHVTVTEDGKYVCWVTGDPIDCVKATDVKTGKIVATVPTHSEVTSLQTLHGGYTLILGCKNGQFLPLKLYDIEKSEVLDKKHNLDNKLLFAPLTLAPVNHKTLETMTNSAKSSASKVMSVSLSRKQTESGGSKSCCIV